MLGNSVLSSTVNNDNASILPSIIQCSYYIVEVKSILTLIEMLMLMEPQRSVKRLFGQIASPQFLAKVHQQMGLLCKFDMFGIYPTGV